MQLIKKIILILVLVSCTEENKTFLYPQVTVKSAQSIEFKKNDFNIDLVDFTGSITNDIINKPLFHGIEENIEIFDLEKTSNKSISQVVIFFKCKFILNRIVIWYEPKEDYSIIKGILFTFEYKDNSLIELVFSIDSVDYFKEKRILCNDDTLIIRKEFKIKILEKVLNCKYDMLSQKKLKFR